MGDSLKLGIAPIITASDLMGVISEPQQLSFFAHVLRTTEADIKAQFDKGGIKPLTRVEMIEMMGNHRKAGFIKQGLITRYDEPLEIEKLQQDLSYKGPRVPLLATDQSYQKLSALVKDEDAKQRLLATGNTNEVVKEPVGYYGMVRSADWWLAPAYTAGEEMAKNLLERYSDSMSKLPQ